MKLQFPQLAAHLKQGLAPVYFLSGDEPLQLQEAADAVRDIALQAGFTERQVMHAEAGFDWSQLAAEASSLSLFAEKRILDLRIPTAKPGREGGAALKAYCENLPQDTLLLIQAGKLEAQAKNTAWVKALDKAGIMIQVWPLNAQQTQQWVDRRLREAGYQPDREAVQVLAARVEGNLLAASQEIEKLKLLLEPGQLSTEQVIEAVTDSARYNSFELADTALKGDGAQAARILQSLEEEGVYPTQILWALARDVRLLTDYLELKALGENPQQALQSLWGARQKLLQQTAQRMSVPQCRELLALCSKLDAIIKGQAAGNSWDGLLQLVSGLSGKPLFPRIQRRLG